VTRFQVALGFQKANQNNCVIIEPEKIR